MSSSPLDDERRHVELRDLRAKVGEEGDARELLGDVGVGPAEAVGQLLPEPRLLRSAHDHGRHVARPAEVVALQRLEERVDICACEAAHVLAVVDVTGRGGDHDVRREVLRLPQVSEQADHRADRVPDEDRRPLAELGDDLEEVVGVAVERAVLLRIVRGHVGVAGADVVEEDGAVPLRIGGREPSPHVLVTAEAVPEEHGGGAGPLDADVVPFPDGHHRIVRRDPVARLARCVVGTSRSDATCRQPRSPRQQPREVGTLALDASRSPAGSRRPRRRIRRRRGSFTLRLHRRSRRRSVV